MAACLPLALTLILSSAIFFTLAKRIKLLSTRNEIAFAQTLVTGEEREGRNKACAQAKTKLHMVQLLEN